MKKFKLIIFTLATSAILFSCASGTRAAIDEKYVFSELTQVERIISHRIDSWGDIDKQSLFITTSPNTSYLIILKRPNNDIAFANSLVFKTRGTNLEAKFDSLSFISPTDSIAPIPAYIDRIYEVKGRDQRKMIRAKILGETDAQEETSNEGV